MQDAADSGICACGAGSVSGRLSSVNRPDQACGGTWLNLSSVSPTDAQMDKENQLVQEKNSAAESREGQGPVWQNGWPGRLLRLLSPSSRREPESEVAGQQPVLSHKLPVLPRMQMPSPKLSPRDSDCWADGADVELEAGLACVEQDASCPDLPPVETAGRGKVACVQESACTCDTSLPTTPLVTKCGHR
jgi:hypothetical protein